MLTGSFDEPVVVLVAAGCSPATQFPVELPRYFCPIQGSSFAPPYDVAVLNYDGGQVPIRCEPSDSVQNDIGGILITQGVSTVCTFIAYDRAGNASTLTPPAITVYWLPPFPPPAVSVLDPSVWPSGTSARVQITTPSSSKVNGTSIMLEYVLLDEPMTSRVAVIDPAATQFDTLPLSQGDNTFKLCAVDFAANRECSAPFTITLP